MSPRRVAARFSRGALLHPATESSWVVIVPSDGMLIARPLTRTTFDPVVSGVDSTSG